MKLNASDAFKAKYGHSCLEHTAVMADQIAAMRAEREARESAMVRPGCLDPRGMIYPAN